MKKSILLLIFLTITLQVIQAKSIYVHKNGKITNKGSNALNDAVPSINRAFELMSNKDIMIIVDTVIVTQSLEIDKKISIFGQGQNKGVLICKSSDVFILASDSIIIGDKNRGITFIGSSSSMRAIYPYKNGDIRDIWIRYNRFVGFKVNATGSNPMVDQYVCPVQFGSKRGLIYNVEFSNNTIEDIGGGPIVKLRESQSIKYAGAGIMVSNIGSIKHSKNPGDGIIIQNNVFKNIYSGAMIGDNNQPYPAIGVVCLPTSEGLSFGVLIKNNTYINDSIPNQFIGIGCMGLRSLIEEKITNFQRMSAMVGNISNFVEIDLNMHITCSEIDIMKVFGINPEDTGGEKIGGTMYFSNSDSAQVYANRSATIFFSEGTFGSFKTLPDKPLHFAGKNHKSIIKISNNEYAIDIQTDSISIRNLQITGDSKNTGVGIQLNSKNLVINKLDLQDLHIKQTTSGVVISNLVLNNFSISKCKLEQVKFDAIRLESKVLENIQITQDTILGSETGITTSRATNLIISKNQITGVSKYAIFSKDVMGDKSCICENIITKGQDGIIIEKSQDIRVRKNLISQIGSSTTTGIVHGPSLLVNSAYNGVISGNTILTPNVSKSLTHKQDAVGVIITGVDWVADSNNVSLFTTSSTQSKGYGMVVNGRGSMTGNNFSGNEVGLCILTDKAIQTRFGLRNTVSSSTSSFVRIGKNTFTNKELDLLTDGSSDVELSSNITLNSADIQGGLFRFGTFNVSVQKAFSLSNKGNLDYLGTGSIQPSAMAVLSNTTGNLDIQWPLLLAKGKTTFALKHGNYSYKISSNTARTQSAIDVLWDITMTGSSTGLLRVSVEGTKFFLPAFNQSKAKFAEVVTTGKFKSLENPGIMNQNSGYYVKEIALKNSGKFFISSEQFTSIEDDYVDTKNYLTWHQSNSELEIRIKDQHIQEIQSLELVDLQGRTLYTDIPTSDIHRIHTSGYAAGIYLLRVTRNDGEHIVTKIILQ